MLDFFADLAFLKSFWKLFSFIFLRILISLAEASCQKNLFNMLIYIFTLQFAFEQLAKSQAGQTLNYFPPATGPLQLVISIGDAHNKLHIFSF